MRLLGRTGATTVHASEADGEHFPSSPNMVSKKSQFFHLKEGVLFGSFGPTLHPPVRPGLRRSIRDYVTEDWCIVQDCSNFNPLTVEEFMLCRYDNVYKWSVLQNVQFCPRSRKAKILTGGIRLSILRIKI